MNQYLIKFILILCVVIGVAFLLLYIGPSTLIDILGVENIYLTVFILAIIGGVSAFTAAGYYTFLFSLALGGANPFILAAFSAPGVLIGDFVFWYVGVQGRNAIKDEYNTYVIKASEWLNKRPKWLIPIVVYLYTGFTPFPGDFMMFIMAFLKYKFRQILIPTLLGNYTLALIISMSAVQGANLNYF